MPIAKLKHIEARLEEIIRRLINENISCFLAGGALGFDTIAALTVLRLKAEYPRIKLFLVLPCRTQTQGWSEKDIAVYEDIKGRCDRYVYTSDEYTKNCMLKRNRCLVYYSGICICYMIKEVGGTAYTVSYAQKKGLRIINIAEEEH